METNQSQQLSRGMQVMSVQFNPDQRGDVAAIKFLAAQQFDELDMWVKEALSKIPEDTDEENLQRRNDIGRLATVAKTHLETFQMYAVKAVTR